MDHENVPSVPSLGNTDQACKKSNPCIKYVFTYNNYVPSEIDKIKSVLSVLGNYIFGEEIGENGTPHLQGWIKFEKKKRITELKKYDYLKKFHWEQQKGSDKQAIQYCMKDNKYHYNFDISEYEPEEELELIDTFHDWQNEILNIIKNKADKRSVYWIHEPFGKTGKSTFCKYLCAKHKAIYIDEGKKSDIINIIYNQKVINSQSIICIDVPRDNQNKISYKAIEQIKNGMICNTKYETGMRLFNSPHVIIFSNFYPETEKLSSDRWKIGKIKNLSIEWDKEKEYNLDD